MRRVLGSLLAPLWLLGTVGLPALHLLDHADDHVHVAGAIVWVGSEEDHDHYDPSDYDEYFEEDFSWDDEEEEEDGEERPSPPGELPPFHHGQGAAAHFGLAALDLEDAPDATPEVVSASAPPPSLGHTVSSRVDATYVRARAPPA